MGLAVGAAAAAAQAARRTASAYTRFSQEHHAWDAIYVNYPEDGSAIVTPEEIRSIPGVLEAHEVLFDYAAIGPGTAWVLDPAGRLGAGDLAHARIVEGRWFDDTKANEVVIGVGLADSEELGVGDTFTLFPPDDLDEFAAVRGDDVADRLAAAVPGLVMHIVGVAAAPGQLLTIGEVGVPLIQFSPAMAPFQTDDHSAVYVRLDDRSTAEAFQRGLSALTDDRGGSQVILHRDLADALNRSLRPQVVALAALAIVLGLAAIVIGVQGVTRVLDRSSRDAAFLRSLGLTRADMTRVAMMEWTGVAVIAAVVAAIVATLASPLSPAGLARTAEPHRGIQLDRAVLVALVVPCVVVLVVAAATRVARSSGSGGSVGPPRVPLLERSRGVVVPVGVQGALDRGGTNARVPVWSTVGAGAIAVAALVAVVVLGASLTRLLSSSDHYGLRWDVQLAQFTEDSIVTAGPPILAADQRVEGLAKGFTDSAVISDVHSTLIAMDPIKGELRPPLLRGAYPQTAEEVALGRRTMNRLGVDLGDIAQFNVEELEIETRLRVVGEVLVPAQGPRGRLDEGVLVTYGWLERVVPEDTPAALFVKHRGGVESADVVADLVAIVQPSEAPSIISPPTPSDIIDLRRARSMPTIFVAALVAVVVAVLAHTIGLSVRRRHRDMAILRALGLERRRLYGIAMTQAATLTALAIVVGIPLGIVSGRLAWNALARTIGSSLGPAVPLLWVLAVIPLGALILGLALAIRPSARACGEGLATHLRAE